MSFFYGFSYEYIKNMENDIFLQYWKAINVIEAQNAMIQLQLESYPHADKKSRAKILKAFQKEATPFKEPISILEFAKRLKNG